MEQDDFNLARNDSPDSLKSKTHYQKKIKSDY